MGQFLNSKEPLTYDNGMVFIPNKELMGSYAAMMKKEKSLGYQEKDMCILFFIR